MFQAIKNEGYVVKPLDLYLLGLSDKDQDRVIDINAPSAAGACLRARYYARTGGEQADDIDPRTRRIFDNGHHLHLRIQDYLTDMGLLLVPEIPVHDIEHKIQGHTDGILKLNGEYAVLEIKSINSKQFTELKDAKDEHKRQGLVYLYCLEKHRRYLKDKYSTNTEFVQSKYRRSVQYREMYLHLKDGTKYTREQKIKLQVDLHLRLDRILWECENPITKVVFLYENKDTQDLKEYVITSTVAQSKNIIRQVLDEYAALNAAVATKQVPERQGQSKNDYGCRFCSYKDACFVV